MEVSGVGSRCKERGGVNPGTLSMGKRRPVPTPTALEAEVGVDNVQV